MTVTDEMVVAARQALYRNQRSLTGKVTKTTLRLAIEAALDEVDALDKAC